MRPTYTHTSYNLVKVKTRIGYAADATISFLENSFMHC